MKRNWHALGDDFRTFAVTELSRPYGLQAHYPAIPKFEIALFCSLYVRSLETH